MKKHYKHNKRRKKSREMRGLMVDVYNNNVELALKKFKKKVKESGLMLELKKKAYFKKKSEVRRERKALGRIRQQRRQMEENK